MQTYTQDTQVSRNSCNPEHPKKYDRREKMQTPHRRCKLHCSSSVSYITVPPMNANKLKLVCSKLVEDTGLTLFSFILPMWTSQKLIVFLYFRREKIIIE